LTLLDEAMSRKEVSEHLAHDIRQGAHARKVMESYQTWFGEGAELSVLRMLGLFDRPADEKALRALLKPPNICGLTEPLIDSSPIEWRTILAKLRRARLLAPEDPHNPGYLDAHPLVREYFGEQLQNKRTEAWKECKEEVSAPAVNCLCFKALTEWHIGETESCKATMAETIPLAKELNDMPALAVALFFAANVAHIEGNSVEVERTACESPAS
jgi:hypothetical protein